MLWGPRVYIPKLVVGAGSPVTHVRLKELIYMRDPSILDIALRSSGKREEERERETQIFTQFPAGISSRGNGRERINFSDLALAFSLPFGRKHVARAATVRLCVAIILYLSRSFFLSLPQGRDNLRTR